MRALIVLCLATGLLSGEAPLPGRDRAFISRIMADAEGGTRPWKTFRAPAESASAEVEVVGELSEAEFRQATFQEFLVWFQADLRRFWLSRGGDPTRNPVAASLPVERFGGNPLPRNAPLGWGY